MKKRTYGIKGIVGCFLLLLFVVISTAGASQPRTVSGTVTDSSGLPLPGVTVVVVGTTIGTVTAEDGSFNLQIPATAETLSFSFVGMHTQEILLEGRTTFKVVMEEESIGLEEVVAVGYGTMRKSDLTGSISQLSSDALEDIKVPNVTQALAGKLAGVQIQQESGAPGRGSLIRIRGTGSITASSSPLYVVDGFPLAEQDISYLNQNDIESIEILKDASAAAIYGSRAANGVVLITTKSGQSGNTKITLDAYYGLQNVTKKLDMLDAGQFIDFSKESFNNTYVEHIAGAQPSDPLNVRPTSGRYRYPAFYDDPQEVARIGKGTDWQDEIFQIAPMQNYNMTVTGGSDKSNFLFSGGYFDQDGVIINTNFKRYTGRIKLDSEVKKWLKLGVNVAPSYTTENQVSEGHQSGDAPVSSALSIAPVVPVYSEDGSYETSSSSKYYKDGIGLTTIANPVAMAKEIVRETYTTRVNSNFYTELSFNNFSFRTSFGADLYHSKYYYFRPATVPKSGFPDMPLPSTQRSANEQSVNVVNWLNENILSYNNKIGDMHSINAIAGFTVQKNAYNYAITEGSDFPNDVIRTIGNATIRTGNSNITEWSLLSYLARVNYNYAEKYYLTGSIRTDGSSRFGSENKYGYFPSASIAWRISSEPFMQNFEGINDMKIRASYGLTGNNSIPNYGAIGLIGNRNYVFGEGSGEIVNGALQTSFSNRELTWEKTKQLDLGFELTTFNNRFTFIFDYYNRYTTDLLLTVDIPSISGFTSSLSNIGELLNYGFEFAIDSRIIDGRNLKWNTNLNFTLNRNEVLALGPEGNPIYANGGVGSTHITSVGGPIGNFFGYRQIGIYTNQEDLDNSPKLSNSRVGDVKYEDVSKDGVIDADDRTVIGNNMPDFTWGMTNSVNFKGFDLNLVLQGVHGNEILHLAKRFYENLEGNQNQLTSVLDRWRSEEEPGNGIIPRAMAQTTGQNNVVSSRWVEDASFIRINNLTLGYTVPGRLMKKYSIQNLRIYLSAQNLYTLTNYSGYNPDLSYRQDNVLAPGSDYGVYPLSRTYTMGFNFIF